MKTKFGMEIGVTQIVSLLVAQFKELNKPCLNEEVTNEGSLFRSWSVKHCKKPSGLSLKNVNFVSISSEYADFPEIQAWELFDGPWKATVQIKHRKFALVDFKI